MLNISFEKVNQTIKYPVEVLNFGVPGFSLDQERDLMTSILKAVECDLIILGIIADDLKMTTRAALRDFTMNEGRDSVDLFLYKNSERTFETIIEVEPKSFSEAPHGYEELFFFKILKERTGWFASHALPCPLHPFLLRRRRPDRVPVRLQELGQAYEHPALPTHPRVARVWNRSPIDRLRLPS